LKSKKINPEHKFLESLYPLKSTLLAGRSAGRVDKNQKKKLCKKHGRSTKTR